MTALKGLQVGQTHSPGTISESLLRLVRVLKDIHPSKFKPHDAGICNFDNLVKGVFGFGYKSMPSGRVTLSRTNLAMLVIGAEGEQNSDSSGEVTGSQVDSPKFLRGPCDLAACQAKGPAVGTIRAP